MLCTSVKKKQKNVHVPSSEFLHGGITPASRDCLLVALRKQRRSAGYGRIQHGCCLLTEGELFSTHKWTVQPINPNQENYRYSLGVPNLVCHGPVRSVRAGVHPGLVCPDGSRSMQRRCGESDSQKQPEFRRAAQALLPSDIRG